jgi:PEP-CTERM motif
MTCFLRTTIAAAALLLLGLPAHADLSFHVDLDTSVLVGNANAPFALFFQLDDGQGIGDANNSVVLSHFTFAGGSGTGGATLDGGASGALASGWTITDSSFFNAVTQSFTAGNTLGFDVTLTTHVDAGPVPDEFSFAILDGAGVEITTTGFGDPLLVVDIDSANPTIQTFAGSGSYAAMGAPSVGATVSPVPEPEAATLFLAGLAIMGWRQRRTRSSVRDAGGR